MTLAVDYTNYSKGNTNDSVTAAAALDVNCFGFGYVVTSHLLIIAVDWVCLYNSETVSL